MTMKIKRISLAMGRSIRHAFLFPGTIVFLLASAFAGSFVTTRIYPNTFVGNVSVGMKTLPEARKLLQSEMKRSVKVAIRDREYEWNYDQMGIELSLDRLDILLATPNRKPFPQNIVDLLSSFTSKRIVPAPITFTGGFTTFLQNALFDFSSDTDELKVGKNNLVTVVRLEQRYTIDPVSLHDAIESSFATRSTQALSPKLVKAESSRLTTLTTLNERLGAVFDTPLLVQISSGGVDQSIIISPKELASLASVTLTGATNDGIAIEIHESGLKNLLSTLSQTVSFIHGKTISFATAKEKLIEVIRARMNKEKDIGLLLSLDDGPTSNGDIADKYIEVDIKQSMMYLFSGGAVAASYRVSTGKYYPTPTGTFTIFNKSPLAFSDIYSVWMPYWMGFYYSNTLNASFGFHEIPYALVHGKKFVYPGDKVGTPSTGGCVALSFGDAKKVYEFAGLGTTVVIYP